MLIWVLFALLTAAALAPVLRPLLTAANPREHPEADAGIAVYKDQLIELDADLARGLIEPAEAANARREIARRLLAESARTPAPAAGGAWIGKLGLGIGALLPLAAIGLYLAHGSPGLPTRPFDATGGALANAPMAELVAKVEARLARDPADGRGWDAIAPVYFKLQRFGDAAAAYGRASELLGETTNRLAGFAEATVMANTGIVDETARLAYEKLARLEPGRVEPRFWLALAKEQDGKLAEAIAEFKALLADAPADASWRPLVGERIAALEQRRARAPAAGERGPSAADVAAADVMSDGDRGKMIAGMVAGLAERLKTETQDVAGWERLIRSYSVLGERARAKAALADARRHLAGNASALAAFTRLETALGLGS